MKALITAADDIRAMMSEPDSSVNFPIIRHLDVTRDVRGTFTALSAYKTKYQELKTQLEQSFETRLVPNSNSWSSCFQFEEVPTHTKPYRRFKVYCKTLQ